MAGGEHSRLPLARRLLDQGAIAAAEAQVQAILESEPEQADALRLAGEIALRKGRAGDAAALFERIGDSGGLGAALHARGQLVEAVPPLAKAVASQPPDGRAWRLLAASLFALETRVPLDELARAATAQGGLDPLIAASVVIPAALAAFMAGDTEACEGWVAAADRLMANTGSEEALRALRRRALRQILLDREERREWASVVYARYLEALLPRMAEDRVAVPDVLHVIGDSHCLSAACRNVQFSGKPHRVCPHLVIGAKAWHLATDMNPSEGPQRGAFALATARIPPGASVVVMCGEIDCRADEGVFVYLQSRPDLSMPDYLDRFAHAYLDGASPHLAGRRLIVCGPPAPPAARATPPGFVDMVRRFNDALAAAAGARQLVYLDAFALTAGEDGTSNGRWHLDDFHLVPEAFEALLEKARL